MDADQIHRLMQDAAAQPLRYLAGVIAEWKATNKPGYRINIEAVAKEIETAAVLFGVTIEPPAPTVTYEPPKMSRAQTPPPRQLGPGLWFGAPPGTDWEKPPTAENGKFVDPLPPPWMVIGATGPFSFNDTQGLSFHDSDRDVVKKLARHDGPVAFESDGHNFRMFVRHVVWSGESRTGPDYGLIHLGIVPFTAESMTIFIAGSTAGSFGPREDG